MSSLIKLLDVTATILNQLDLGVCLLDREGKIAFANGEFHRQSKAYDVFNMFRCGRLNIQAIAKQNNLGPQIRDALTNSDCNASPQRETIVVGTKHEASVLYLDVIPFHSDEEDGTHGFDGAVLISKDETRPKKIDLDLIRKAYQDVTKAELQVIELIVQGLTNAEIAERRSRSVETVSSQVKSILDKTHVSNRTQLVTLLGKFVLRPA